MGSHGSRVEERSVGRPARVVLGTGLGLVAVPLLLRLAGADLGGFAGPYRDFVAPACIVLAGLAALARALTRHDDRLSWALLAGAIAVFLAGSLLSELIAGTEGTAAGQPTWADGVYLAAYPLLFAGVGLLLRRRGGGGRRVWIDAVAAGTGFASLAAALAFDHVVSGERGLTRGQIAIELAYPLLDLGLLGLIVALVAFDGRRPDAGRFLLLAGAVVLALTDTRYSVDVGRASPADDTANAGAYALGFLLLARAAWGPPLRPTLRLRRESALELAPPLVAAACAVGVLVLGTQRAIPLVAVVLAAVAVLAALGRTATEYRALAELARSRHEALTDELTGLANRRLLFRTLDAALAGGRPAELALIDLDGFKAYNDVYGHLEGDRLLAHLGHAMAVAVGGQGSAFRLGGDEFCLLLDGHGQAGELLDRLGEAAARAAAGAGSIGLSWGSVLLPDEAADADAAIRLADQRMYAVKGERASSVRR